MWGKVKEDVGCVKKCGGVHEVSVESVKKCDGVWGR